MKKFIKEYRVELIGAAVMLLAVFLLLNRSRVGAARWTGQVFLWKVSTWFGNLLDAIIRYISRMSAMELLAWFLVIGGVVFIVWRIRYRILHSARWQTRACPKCDSSIHRVRRTSFDRFLGSFLLPNSARYRCSNEDCQWSGLCAMSPPGEHR